MGSKTVWLTPVLKAIEEKAGYSSYSPSYEMVAKVASQNLPILAAVSAPTSLAIQQAEEAKVTLVAYVQPDRQVVFSHPNRLVEALAG